MTKNNETNKQLNMVEDEYSENDYSSSDNRLSKIYKNSEDYEQLLNQCKDDPFEGGYILYLNWLFERIDKKQCNKYSSLLILLFKYIFSETKECPMDVNRARDGIALRKRFYEETNLISEDMYERMTKDDCTWLEMLIALAIRIDDQMMFDMNLGNRTSEWFWMMLNQMDLDKFDNKHMDEKQVVNIINKLGSRNYDNQGKNGIFKCKNDVRKVDIWYQMMQYFNENWIRL